MVHAPPAALCRPDQEITEERGLSNGCKASWNRRVTPSDLAAISAGTSALILLQGDEMIMRRPLLGPFLAGSSVGILIAAAWTIHRWRRK